jgi:DNA-binding MarR family transcriptional regulator
LPVSIWVRLLKAYGLMTRVLRRGLPPGITLPQFDLLAQLLRHEREQDEVGEGMTPTALTRRLLVTGGNVTVIVAGLTRDGLVERRRGVKDRRTVHLRLTPRGRALVERELPRHRSAVAALLSSVPERQLERLRELLGRVNDALER